MVTDQSLLPVLVRVALSVPSAPGLTVTVDFDRDISHSCNSGTVRLKSSESDAF